MTKAERLRVTLREKPILKVMGAHDALGAKLIEKHGFDAIWASGFEIATAHGVPDANILTMTENLDAAIHMHMASALPIICDCDTGYGNAINVMHMVRKYESAGMAAVVIEDKRFPKINSFIPGRQELASIEEFVGKIEAARAARNHENGIMVFARIEALIAGWGMDEAFRRALAYQEAGADGLVIHSKSTSPDEIFRFAELWGKRAVACPLVAIPTTYYKVTSEELARNGFKIAIYANQGIRASVRAMEKVFENIQREGTTAGVEDKIASMEDLFRLQGMPAYQEQEKRYSGEKEKISAVIPAAADHKFQPELSSILQDQPLCMLKVGPKSLLEHQLDILRSVSIESIHVVVGYQKDKVQAKGIHKIENPDFDTKKSAYSVMLGVEKSAGKTVVCYSDIIFDRQIPEMLLESDYPVTLVIDRAFRSLPRRDKGLDLVLTEEAAPAKFSRNLAPEKFKRIARIGKRIDPEEANYEFIGMMLFSQEGLKQLKEAWQEAVKKYSEKPFYEAPDASSASMTDLLQLMIDRGVEVRGLVIEHGWSEVYSLEDYERINRYFGQKIPEGVIS